MPVTNGPQIDLNQIHVVASGGSGANTQCTQNDSDIRGLIGKASGAQSALSEWYGASLAFTTSITSGFVPYQRGFTEQGSKSHTYSRWPNPSSDSGAVATQGGWIPNSNGVAWVVDQFVAAFTPGQASTSTQIRAFFRDSTLSTSSARTSQAPYYSYTWPMGNVTVASDANFTQNVVVLSPSGWFSQNTSAILYTSWISGVAWGYAFSTDAQRNAALTTFTSNFYVKIEP